MLSCKLLSSSGKTSSNQRSRRLAPPTLRNQWSGSNPLGVPLWLLLVASSRWQQFRRKGRWVQWRQVLLRRIWLIKTPSLLFWRILVYFRGRGSGSVAVKRRGRWSEMVLWFYMQSHGYLVVMDSNFFKFLSFFIQKFVKMFLSNDLLFFF